VVGGLRVCVYGSTEVQTGRWWCNLMECDRLTDLGVAGSTIFKTGTLKNQIGGHGPDSSCSEQGQVASCNEMGNELSDSIKYREIFSYLINYQFLNRDSALLK
jgi:hypothetical protein